MHAHLPRGRTQIPTVYRPLAAESLETRCLLTVGAPGGSVDPLPWSVPAGPPDLACPISTLLTLPADRRLADLNNDGAVDAADAEIMFSAWGGNGASDLNTDGIVDAADAGILFEQWTGDGADPQPLVGSAASPFPLVSDPALVPGNSQGRSARFQQWFSPQQMPEMATIGMLRFRLDDATPHLPVGQDLTYALEVRIAPGPATANELLPVFAQNLRGPAVKVYDKLLTLSSHATENQADADWIELVFSDPVTINPADGGWLIDITLRGMYGDSLDFLLDAVPSSQQSVALYSPDDRVSPQGQFMPNVPLVELQVIPGAISYVDVATRCIDAMGLDPIDAADLHESLATLHAAGTSNDRAAIPLAITQYQNRVDQLADQGQIDPTQWSTLHELGREEAMAVGGGLNGLNQGFRPFGLQAEFGLPGFDWTLLRLERSVATVLPQDHPDRANWLMQAETADAHLQVALASAKQGEVNEPELKKAYEELCKLVEKAKQDGTLTGEELKFVEDLKKTLEDPALLVKVFESLVKVIQDGDLDQDDLTNLNELKESLQSIRSKLSSDGILGKALDQVIRILCQLGAALDSNDLVSISTSTAGGKTFIRIDVNSEIEIRLLELLDLDTQSDYGKTNIYFDLHIKKDAVITLCPDGDDAQGVPKLKIDFTPKDAVDLDLDSSGWWVVHALESITGIPDLDKFCFDEIRFEDGKTVIKGTSGGKPVEITLSQDGVKVVVEGKVVFPQ